MESCNVTVFRLVKTYPWNIEVKDAWDVKVRIGEYSFIYDNGILVH